MSAPGGCLLQGVSTPGGCLLQGGVCSEGGVCSRGGGIPACTEADTPPCEQSDKQVQKYYLGHNYVAAGNKYKKRTL